MFSQRKQVRKISKREPIAETFLKPESWHSSFWSVSSKSLKDGRRRIKIASRKCI